MRGVGEPDPRGAPPAGRRSMFFLWAPLFWDDHISHAVFFDGPDGEALVREGSPRRSSPTATAMPPATTATETRMVTARPSRSATTPAPDSRRRRSSTSSTSHGRVRTITFEPLLRFQMKGLGYGHPTWAQGRWQGELTVAGESFDPDELDLLRPENIHVQQVFRVHDGKRTGIGALEQLVVGPYAPAGFTAATDGATPTPDTSARTVHNAAITTTPPDRPHPTSTEGSAMTITASTTLVTNIGTHLRRRARMSPDLEAIVDVATGRRYTYTSLHRRATQVAAALHGLGLARGDRVAILAPNGHQYSETFYGAALGRHGRVASAGQRRHASTASKGSSASLPSSATSSGTRYATAVEQAVTSRAATGGTTYLPNPAILASAAKPC